MANQETYVSHVEKQKLDFEAKVLKDNKTVVFRVGTTTHFFTLEQALEMSSKLEAAVIDVNYRQEKELYPDGNIPEIVDDIRFEDCITPQQFADQEMGPTKAEKHGEDHE